MALFGLLKDSKDPGGMTGNDKLALLFSGISDFGALRSGQEANAIDSLTKAMADRRAKVASASSMGRIMSALNPVDTPPAAIPQAQNVGDYAPRFATPEVAATQQLPQRLPQRSLADPEVQQVIMAEAARGQNVSPMLSMLQAFQPQKPQIVEGPDGIYSVDAKGNPTKIQAYPEKAAPDHLPPGMIRNPQTGKLEWEPGYVDAQSQLSGVRREAVVSRPMPRAAGGGGRGGGGRKISGRVLGPSLPDGY